MVLNFADSGTGTTTTSEADVFSQVTLDALHASVVHLDQMVGGDTWVFRVYTWDTADGIERQFSIHTFTGDQASEVQLFDFLPSKRYRVSVQRTAGTDGAYSFERYTIV